MGGSSPAPAAPGPARYRPLTSSSLSVVREVPPRRTACRARLPALRSPHYSTRASGARSASRALVFDRVHRVWHSRLGERGSSGRSHGRDQAAFETPRPTCRRRATMACVSRVRRADDELGYWSSFNDMLAQIQTRAGAAAAPRALEEEVAARTASCGGQGARRGRQPREERVPRQHEPRDPHADERRPRHDRAGARHATLHARAARVPGDRASRRPTRCWHHQRHPRLLEDRGRQARPRADAASTCATRARTTRCDALALRGARRRA